MISSLRSGTISTSLNLVEKLVIKNDVEFKKDLRVDGVVSDKNTMTSEEYEKIKKEILCQK